MWVCVRSSAGTVVKVLGCVFQKHRKLKYIVDGAVGSHLFGSSWGFGALLKGLTSVVVLKVEESTGHSLPQPTIPDASETQTYNLWVPRLSNHQATTAPNYTCMKYVGHWFSFFFQHFGTHQYTCTGPSSSTHLRGDVVRGPTKGLGGYSIKHVLLAHAKVSNFDMTLHVQHDIIQL